MPIQFTTDGSPGYRRLALWQDIVCDVFVGLDCKSDLGSAFRGSVTQAPLGKAICSDVSSDRQHVFRTPSRIARSDQDFVLIALGNRGDGGVVQDGRETVIHPGEFALYDTTRPYELKFNDTFTQTIFKVPREMLQRRLGGTEALTAISFGADVPLDHPLYLLLAESRLAHWSAAGSRVRVEVLGVGPSFDPDEARFEIDPGTFDRLREGVLETLSVLVDLAAAGRFPLNEESRVCAYCPYVRACRRAHAPTLERLAAAPGGAPYALLRRKSTRAPTLDAVRARAGAEEEA